LLGPGVEWCDRGGTGGAFMSPPTRPPDRRSRAVDAPVIAAGAERMSIHCSIGDSAAVDDPI
jgi:hypothetical protein